METRARPITVVAMTTAGHRRLLPKVMVAETIAIGAAEGTKEVREPAVAAAVHPSGRRAVAERAAAATTVATAVATAVAIRVRATLRVAAVATAVAIRVRATLRVAAVAAAATAPIAAMREEATTARVAAAAAAATRGTAAEAPRRRPRDRGAHHHRRRPEAARHQHLPPTEEAGRGEVTALQHRAAVEVAMARAVTTRTVHRTAAVAVAAAPMEVVHTAEADHTAARVATTGGEQLTLDNTF